VEQALADLVDIAHDQAEAQRHLVTAQGAASREARLWNSAILLVALATLVFQLLLQQSASPAPPGTVPTVTQPLMVRGKAVFSATSSTIANRSSSGSAGADTSTTG